MILKNKPWGAAKVLEDFSLLDTSLAEKRYELKKITVYEGIIYISSKQDDWYIEKKSPTKIQLWHRNKKRTTSEFHKEKKQFKDPIECLKYIQHHDKKIYALGHSGVYRKTKMERLFEQVSSC